MFKALFKPSVPVYQQSEVGECGSICIAMIASFHGHETLPIHMRTQCAKMNLSQRGCNLSDLMRLAQSFDLNTVALRGEVHELCEVTLPCILHWNLNHFVVLTAIKNHQFVIHDPARGKVVLNEQQMSQHFTGVVLTVQPSVQFKPQKAPKQHSFRALFRQIPQLGKHLWSLFALSLLLQLLQIVSPYYMQWTVDHVLVKQAPNTMSLLAIVFACVLLVKVIFSALRTWLIVRLNTELAYGFGTQIMQHLLKLPASFFEPRHIGDIQSRFHSVHFLRERLANGIVESLLDGIMLFLLLAIMFLYSPSLSLCVVFALVFYTLLRAVFYPQLHLHSQTLLQLQAQEATTFIDSLKQWRLQLMSNLQEMRAQQWAQSYTHTLRQDVRLKVWQLGFDSMHTLIIGTTHIAVLWLAAQMILAQQMSIGMLLAFVAYQQFALESGVRVVEQWLQFRLLNLHLQRLSDITHTEVETHRIGHTPIAPSGKGLNIQLVGVSFRYLGAANNTLDNVNITVKAGESVVITGPSGIGKSTLLKIILGLYQPTSGKVLCDGIDIRDIGLLAYRAQISSVLQNDTLLQGSILENITLFEENVDFERIHKLLRIMLLQDVLAQLPMGLHTPCGELSEQLSSGQVQRLLLVRALYRQPRVLIMDEATAHLDKQTEQLISQALKDMSMTRIIVAHREETIATAQRQINLATLLPVIRG